MANHDRSSGLTLDMNGQHINMMGCMQLDLTKCNPCMYIYMQTVYQKTVNMGNICNVIKIIFVLYIFSHIFTSFKGTRAT